MSERSFYRQIESFGDSLPPLEDWHPPLSGEMDCLIRKDGTWMLEGSKLENARLLRLFSTVLKYEDNAYYLLTPVEKWRIKVEDLPFVVVTLDVNEAHSDRQTFTLRTNVGDEFNIDAEHTLGASPVPGNREQQAIPFVHVRAGLHARFNRNSYLQLATYLQPVANTDDYTVRSAQTHFTLHIPQVDD